MTADAQGSKDMLLPMSIPDYEISYIRAEPVLFEVKFLLNGVVTGRPRSLVRGFRSGCATVVCTLCDRIPGRRRSEVIPHMLAHYDALPPDLKSTCALDARASLESWRLELSELFPRCVP